jgi:hypothetical protein
MLARVSTATGRPGGGRNRLGRERFDPIPLPVRAERQHFYRPDFDGPAAKGIHEGRPEKRIGGGIRFPHAQQRVTSPVGQHAETAPTAAHQLGKRQTGYFLQLRRHHAHLGQGPETAAGRVVKDGKRDDLPG